jgi:hypothetical protein
VLVVALCRAAGIPARAAFGLVYLANGDEKRRATKGIAGYHAWSEVWLGRWVTVDAAIFEIGTGARYIHFGYNEPGEEGGMGAMVRAIGKASMEITAYTLKDGTSVDVKTGKSTPGKPADKSGEKQPAGKPADKPAEKPAKAAA